MMTPFNRVKLQSLEFLSVDRTGVVAASIFPAEMGLFHGLNVRFEVCRTALATPRRRRS